MIETLAQAAQWVLLAAGVLSLLALVGLAVLRLIARHNQRRYEKRMDPNGARWTSPLGRLRVLDAGGTRVIHVVDVIHVVEPEERDAVLRAAGVERAS